MHVNAKKMAFTGDVYKRQQSISEGNKVLTYKGTLAESESSYDLSLIHI